MTMLNRLEKRTRLVAGSVGAEFAMVLPLLLLLLFGVIDAGRYMWTLNSVEKATQMGARMAVVTTMVPTDLASKNFGTTLGQGAPIPTASFGSMQCQMSGGSLACTCVSNCSGIGVTADPVSFGGVAARMNQIAGVIAPANVRITYTNVGLGYAGDPTGPDVAPLVTVSAINVGFDSLIGRMFGINLTLPTVSAALTLEDGQGSFSN